jgi:hypothetical protein
MDLIHRKTTFQRRTASAAALAIFAGFVLVGCNPDPEALQKLNDTNTTDLHSRTEQMLGDAYAKTGAPAKIEREPASDDPDQILRYPNSTVLAGSTPSKKLYRTTDELGVVLDHYRTVLSDVDPQRSGLGEMEQTDQEMDGDHVTVITAAGTRERGLAYRVEISRVMGDVIIKVTNARRSDAITTVR